MVGRDASPLSRRQALLVAAALAALGILLTSPSLWTGLWADDIGQAEFLLAKLDGRSGEAWWEMFKLAERNPAKIFGGGYPWWTASDLSVSFFRPVTVATHYLDYALWPTSPMLMHAQNIAIFGLVCIAAFSLFRHAERDARVATIAGLIYVCSYIHWSAVSWVANRNALLATLFAILAIRCYWRGRTEHHVLLRVGAPILLVLSLLSAEVGVATVAFVLGFELVQARDAWSRRVVAASTMLVPVILWRIGYNALGCGAIASGAYLDPVRSPTGFLEEVPFRLMVELAFLITPLRAIWIGGLTSSAIWAIGVLLTLSGLAFVLLIVRCRAATLRWGVPAVLSLLPLVASLPGERLLTISLLGFAPLAAHGLVRCMDLWRHGARVQPTLLAAPLVVSLFVVSPAVLVLGAHDSSFGQAAATTAPGLDIGSDEEVGHRSLVVVAAPTLEAVRGIGLARARAGKKLPLFTLTLGVGPDPVAERVGCCSVEVSDDQGLFLEPLSRFFRGPQRPFAVGDRVKTLAFEASIVEVRDGYATRVLFDFGQSLDSGRLVFVGWQQGDFRRWDG